MAEQGSLKSEKHNYTIADFARYSKGLKIF